MNKVTAGIFLAVAVVTISVGLVVVNAMLIGWNNMPMEFTLVNKEHITGDFWNGEQYRMYYDSTGYYLTDKASFERFQIGDWFNGTIILLNTY